MTPRRKLKLRPPPPPLELAEQTAVFEWAAWNERRIPALKLLFAVPNGLRTSIGAAVKMKKAGMKKGVPDVVLPISTNFGHHACGLYIEMKRVRGGVVSEEQKWWRERLIEQGYTVVTAAGAKEAIAAITEYLGGNL